MKGNGKPIRIDVHNHFVFPEYLEALAKVGITNSAGMDYLEWTPQIAEDFMDRYGIAVIVTALTFPGVYFGDQSAANDLARKCNEYIAQVVRDRPTRFSGLMNLPLPGVDASLREIEYAFDTLKLDGVTLLSNYEGKYLGDPAFEVYAELNRRKAVVHIHPATPPKNQIPALAFKGYTLEFPFDTTRVGANLVVTGTVKRYPDIKFILSHGGGALPYLARRIARGISKVDKEFNEAISLFQGLYYDTALTSPYMYGFLLAFVKPSHIVFGTDFILAAEDQTPYTIGLIDGCDALDTQMREAIYYKNALALFPRLQKIMAST